MRTRRIKAFVLSLALMFCASKACAVTIFGHEFNAPWSLAYKEKKLQKQQESETEPMVQTVEEWHERATNVRMEHRTAEPYKAEVNAKLVQKWDIPTFFEKYNNAPGTRELNLEKLKIDKFVRSQGVISPDFKLMAYTESYFFPSNQTTMSSFFIYPLDMSKGKKERVIDANVFAGAKKTPLIKSSDENLKEFLFSTFTVVDWSKDSKTVLLKEKMGSGKNGIYKTNIWAYFLETEEERSYEHLNDAITKYWFYKDRLILNAYRWDVTPLGFLAKDENIVICTAQTYNEKNQEKVFLGTWSINLKTGAVSLVSESPETEFEISTNGLILNKKLP